MNRHTATDARRLSPRLAAVLFLGLDSTCEQLLRPGQGRHRG